MVYKMKMKLKWRRIRRCRRKINSVVILFHTSISVLQQISGSFLGIKGYRNSSNFSFPMYRAHSANIIKL